MSPMGSLFAQYILVIEPARMFDIEISIIVLLIAVMGGVGNVWGPLIGTIILIPLVCLIEQPWKLTPRLDSTISVIYLGFISTGIAWLLRFRILVNNGLIFQSQVSYLIPIFGTILSYIFLKELITIKAFISLVAVCVGIYFVRKADFVKTI